MYVCRYDAKQPRQLHRLDCQSTTIDRCIADVMDLSTLPKLSM